MEKQIQAKTMLHQTKQKLFKETAQRSSIIQKLEKEVITLDITAAVGLGREIYHILHGEVRTPGMCWCFSGETVNLHIDRGKRKVFRRKEGAAAEDQQAGGRRREDHVDRPAQVCVSSITLGMVASVCVASKWVCLDESACSRINMLEEEKRLLHHQIQMLSRQNCSLESALRKSASRLEVAPLKQVPPPRMPLRTQKWVTSPFAADVRSICS